MDLSAEISEIREHTQQYPELLQAHHFLYDLRIKPSKIKYDFVLMGINPGESAKDWETKLDPTEETSLFTFHTKERNDPWMRQLDFFLGNRSVVQTQMFFWSSKNTAEFEKRFGPLKNNQHLSFCRGMNLKLFAKHTPRAIIFPGIGMANIASSLYELKHKKTWFSKDKKRLVAQYSDGVYPWIFTQHWTGAWGFSNALRQETKEILDELFSQFQ